MAEPAHIPSPADIATACTAIRSEWSTVTTATRLTMATDAQVELLASILRPMAREAGLALADDPLIRPQTGRKPN